MSDDAKPSAKVFFDADCPACCKLAAFAARRTPDAEFHPWQEFRETPAGRALVPEAVRSRPADRLRVLFGEDVLEGEAAWAFLLDRNRDLAGLGWLAAQLGLTSTAARAMAKAGGVVRRLCLRCPKPPLR
jgi:hypothetical protein